MPGWEQTAAWLQEPYNRTALALLQIAGVVTALALTAGLASAVHNWRRRRKRRDAFAPAQASVDGQTQPVEPPMDGAASSEPDPKAAYAAILRLTPDDPRARKGLGR